MKKCKIVAITNNKGGVGKTFIAVHLAWYLHLKGYKTILVDMDIEQGDATKWVTQYKIKDPEAGKIYEGYKGLRVVWMRGMDTTIREDYDGIVVVDGRPSVRVGAFSMFQADVIIAPVDGRLSVENLRALIDLLKDIEGIKRRIVVINRQKPRTLISKYQFDLVKHLFGGELYYSPISESVKVREAEARGLPVWECKGRYSATVNVLLDFLRDMEQKINEIK